MLGGCSTSAVLNCADVNVCARGDVCTPDGCRTLCHTHQDCPTMMSCGFDGFCEDICSTADARCLATAHPRLPPASDPNIPSDKTVDSDFDGLANTIDRCPHDYYNDRDKDGLCGDVDPCDLDNIAQINAPSAHPANIVLSSISLQNSGSNVATNIRRGDTFTVQLAYYLRDDDCSTCVDQILSGIVRPGSETVSLQGCFFSGLTQSGCETPPAGQDGGVCGISTVSFTAPDLPGTYYLRFERTWQSTCVLHWIAPPPTADYAAICVR